MMPKALVFSLGLLFVSDLLACPYCVGSTQGGKDSNTTLILALFILAIYIPYYLIYRMIKKHRVLMQSVKEAHDNPGSTHP
jgi:hypothetical protein